MKSEKSVYDRVKEVMVDQLGCLAEEVKPEAHLINDLGVDSLDTVELIMGIEEEFDIEIDDDQAEKLLTVAQVVAHVERLVPAQVKAS